MFRGLEGNDPFDDVTDEGIECGAGFNQLQETRSVSSEDQPTGFRKRATDFVKGNKTPLALGATALALGAAACLIPTDEDQEDKKAEVNASGYSTVTKAAGVLGTVGALAGLYKFYKSRKSAAAQSEESSEDAATGRISRKISKRAKSSPTGKTSMIMIIGAILALLLIGGLVWYCLRKNECHDEPEDLEMGLQELENQQ